MDRNKIDELKSRMRLYDDDAKPLTGSDGQYTRLAIVGLRPERGNERHFTLFAESSKLVDAIARATNTPEWIHEGFTEKWLYIEEVLRKPSATDTIQGYLQKIDSNELWMALYEYLKSTGIMDRFSKSIKGKTYGLPSDMHMPAGLPKDLNPRTRFLVPKKKEDE